MKLYMHPVSTATRPVRLLIAENAINCEADIVECRSCPPLTGTEGSDLEASFDVAV